MHFDGVVSGVEVHGAATTTKVWVSTPGHLRPAPCQRPGWYVLGAGGVAPSRCEGPGIC